MIMDWADIWPVFLTGGLLCTAGQLLLDCTNLTAPRILVLFVVAGGLLAALGIYEPLVQLTKNGSTVPITGFGYALVRGAILEAQKAGLLGAFTGGLKATAAGITTALTVGYLIALISRPKSKSE